MTSVIRRRTYAPSGEPSMTLQQFKEECDINNILSQYKKTGIIQHISKSQPLYAELPDSIDYQQSLHTIMAAQDAFEALPSVVRRYFHNDPAELLNAMTDPAMNDKLIELGVRNLPATPQPAGNPANVPPVGNPTTAPGGEPKLP